MKKTRTIALLIATSLCLISTSTFATTFPVEGSATTGTTTSKPNVTRLQGINRIATAKTVATKYKSGLIQNVVLATQSTFPDALSGSVLATKLGAPILLVGKSASGNADTFNYITTHLQKTGTVYILGGTGAVGNDIVTTLKKEGYTKFVRLGGSKREETAGLICDRQAVAQGTPVVLATSSNFPDALSISSIASEKGYPILLSSLETIPDQTISRLTRIKPSIVYIVGGTGVISGNVVNQIRGTLGIPANKIIRLSGGNRYETGLAVANHFEFMGSDAVVATGLNFPDALAGSVLAASLNAPILLIDNNNYIKQKAYLDKAKIGNIYVLGGKSAVSDNIVSILKNEKIKEIPKAGSLVYTWPKVRSEILNANVGPNLTEITSGTGDDKITLINYSTRKDLPGSSFDIFNLVDIKGYVPNMDIGMGITGYSSKDPAVIKNITLAYSVVCEAIFPNQGPEFDKLSDMVKLRHVKKGNMQYDLPTVLFFGGRRVFMTPHSWGHTSIDFSAINDKTDIWKELYAMPDMEHLKFTKAELKKYMPELKNY